MPLTGAIPEGPSLFCPAALGCAFEPQTHSSADSGMPHAAGAVPTNSRRLFGPNTQLEASRTWPGQVPCDHVDIQPEDLATVNLRSLVTDEFVDTARTARATGAFSDRKNR